MPDPPFQPLGRYCLHIYIPQSIPLSACGGFIGRGLTDSRGSHPLWASPSLILCPYYSMACYACQGVFRNFFGFFLPLSFLRSHGSPSGLGRPDSPPFRSDHPHPCAALLPAMPWWRRPDASFTDFPRHRVLRGQSLDSLGDHPPSMVLLYHTRSDLSRVF